ncbi:TPA: hypothetical protein V1O56_001411 [Streptococcus pneumoniae]|nr:hypothetical protein [Streptococcus pneumoniae]
MGIDQYLKVIKEGVFGRDVRQAIHDGIEQVYEDATFDGNANMEVAKARGEHNNLSERLKNMVAQIQSLSDSAPKGVYKNIEALNTAFPKGRDGIYLTQNDGKWNFWDGSKWVPGGNYQSPAQPDLEYNDIDYSAISDIELWAQIHEMYANGYDIEKGTGYPIFSKTNGEIGSIITGSGTQNYWTKRTIVVEQGEVYSARIQQAANSAYYVYFLDEGDSVIARAVKNKGVATKPERYYFSVPKGSKKMLILSFESGSVVWKGLSKNKLTTFTKTALPGKFENDTSKLGQFRTLDRRVSTKTIQYCKTETLIRVNKSGYLFFIDTFNENEEYLKTLTENVEIIIPAGTYYRLTIQTVDDREQKADVSTMYYSITCYQKSDNDFNVLNSLAHARFNSNFKFQSKLYGIRKSDISRRYPAETLIDLGIEGLQSFAIDIGNNIGYAFGWYNNTSKAIKFDLSTKRELERINKPDSGHDNDAVFVNGNVYIASADKRSDDVASLLYKWNIEENTVTKINVSGVIGKPENGSRRIISGICSAENNPENLYIVTTDHDYNLPFDGMHKEDDYLSIYYYSPQNNTGYLLWRSKWDELYVQGATAVNDIMYIACNHQHTSTEGYKGIVIKVIDLVARMQVDEIELIGDFEPESINHVYENGNLYLLLGIAKYNSFSKVVKIKID